MLCVRDIARCSRTGTVSYPGSRAAFTLIELLSVVAIIGVLASIGMPRYWDTVERARVAKAIGDLRTLAIDLLSQDSLPSSLAAINRSTLLDPWGRPYRYLKFTSVAPVKLRVATPPPGARMDRFLVPINSMFDLYSTGKDGKTQVALTAPVSHDDVVVANDGGFIGLAKNY